MLEHAIACKNANGLFSTKNTEGDDVMFLTFCCDMNFLCSPVNGKRKEMIKHSQGGISWLLK